MKPRLKSGLNSAIQEWVDEYRELDEWSDGDFADMTICLMADAAAVVYDTIIGMKEYVKRHPKEL